LIEAPQQHLHLYGLSADDIAAVIARQAATLPQITTRED
jgi:hypothetical protein